MKWKYLKKLGGREGRVEGVEEEGDEEIEEEIRRAVENEEDNRGKGEEKLKKFCGISLLCETQLWHSTSSPKFN